MECPEGFASLGDVATLHNTPKAMDYRCLNRSTLTPARPGLAVASIRYRCKLSSLMIARCCISECERMSHRLYSFIPFRPAIRGDCAIFRSSPLDIARQLAFLVEGATVT